MVKVKHGFKIGDEVVLLPKKKGWENLHPYYIPAMDRACKAGRVFTVKSFSDELVNIGGYNSLPEWLDHYKPTLENI